MTQTERLKALWDLNRRMWDENSKYYDSTGKITLAIEDIKNTPGCTHVNHHGELAVYQDGDKLHCAYCNEDIH